MGTEPEGELDKDVMVNALAELGRRCDTECSLVIVGGAAAVLSGWLHRGTTDIDVLLAWPRLVTLKALISDVAEHLGLGDGWLNDAAKAYVEVLPPEYTGRLSAHRAFGKLKVQVVGRPDFILLKLYALRATDVLDLRAMQPPISPDEMDFVRVQLPRIARFNPVQAHRIELFLAAEEGRFDE